MSVGDSHHVAVIFSRSFASTHSTSRSFPDNFSNLFNVRGFTGN